VLGAHELVLQPLRLRLRGVDDQLHPRGQPHVGAVRLRHALEERARVGGNLRRIQIELAHDRRDDAAGLLDEGHQQVLGRDLGVVLLGRQVLGGDHRLLRLFSKFVQVHVVLYAAGCFFAVPPFNFASAS
jgi:hypothetical protein